MKILETIITFFSCS